jgi:colanic acid biosynthesis glycosyl transferase WcaI
MKLSIVSINYAPERTGIGVYTTGLAEYLAADGFAVTVHTGYPYYPQWRKAPADRGPKWRRETRAGVSVRRCPLYVPARPSAATRILHELSFVASAALGYLFAARADCTIIVSPPLALAPAIGLLAKLKRSRTVLHIQDLQPDAALELGMLRPGALARALHALEKLGYRLVDRISTISDGMRARILAKGIDPRRVSLLRNWANDDLVTPLPRETALRREWGIADTDFVVLYSGNLGRKQGLSSLLAVAARLAARPEIRFVIVGDGAEKPDLLDEAAALGLRNVMFQPLQPLARLSELLATADVSVIPQKRGMSDIVLPSKACNILASARPVVAAAPPTSDLARIVTEADCGVLVAPEDEVAMAQAILALHAAPERRAAYGANARRHVTARLGYRALAGEFAARLRDWHREAQGGGPVPAPRGPDAA